MYVQGIDTDKGAGTYSREGPAGIETTVSPSVLGSNPGRRSDKRFQLIKRTQQTYVVLKTSSTRDCG